MVKTLEEVLVNYEAAMREYLIWVEHMKRKYAGSCSMEDMMSVWSDFDYHDSRNYVARYEAMQRLLGLSDEEVRTIANKIRLAIAPTEIDTESSEVKAVS